MAQQALESLFLIRVIAQLLGSACLLTATTGIAGFNICGSTLHSALHLPIQLSSGKDLQGSALAHLQQRFKDVQYLWDNACSTG